MNNPDPTLLDQAKFYGALVLVWLSGEVGRLAVAGAAGGFVRGLMSEKRRFRDGIMAMVTGGIMALYATPLTVALFESIPALSRIKGDVAGAAGFATGVAGMSLAKLILGMVEAHIKRISGGPGDA